MKGFCAGSKANVEFLARREQAFASLRTGHSIVGTGLLVMGVGCRCQELGPSAWSIGVDSVLDGTETRFVEMRQKPGRDWAALQPRQSRPCF